MRNGYVFAINDRRNYDIMERRDGAVVCVVATCNTRSNAERITKLLNLALRVVKQERAR